MTSPQMKLIFCICGLGLAIFFGFGVFLAARQSPVWVRFSGLFIGILGAAYGWLCFWLEFYRGSLPYRSRAYLDHYRTLVGGSIIGALVVLGIYGLASFYLKRHDRSNQALQPTAGRSDV
jgi:H+/Cl- antiporter ClcA